MKTTSEIVIIAVGICPLSMTLFWCLLLTLNGFTLCYSVFLVNIEQVNAAGYGNDNDSDGNDAYVDRGPRAEGRGKPIPLKFRLDHVCWCS